MANSKNTGLSHNGITPGNAYKGDKKIEENRQSVNSNNGINPSFPHGVRGGMKKGKLDADNGLAFKGDNRIERNRFGEYVDTKTKGGTSTHGLRGGHHNLKQDSFEFQNTGAYGSSTQKFDVPEQTNTSLSGKTSSMIKGKGGRAAADLPAVQNSTGEGWNPYYGVMNSLTEEGNDWDKLRRSELNMFGANLKINKKFYRFGYLNPSDAVGNTREYLFFTRPDLHIFDNTDKALYKPLSNIRFWQEMFDYRRDVLEQMCTNGPKAPRNNKMNYLLSNQVSSSLDVPTNESNMIDTAANIYGVSLSYRGSSEGSDDNFDFSLEFKDNRNLDVFYFFKAYEEYETLKHHGIVKPRKYYLQNKVLHDQFAIYKFIVDEDMTTILYYCKYYGVVPKNMPRDVFSNVNFENGITYTVNFHAQFFEDVDPKIIADFNGWMLNYNKAYSPNSNYLDIMFRTQNNFLFPVTKSGNRDNRPASTAFVYRDQNDNKYKLCFIK